jgi:hypothetical protein
MTKLHDRIAQLLRDSKPKIGPREVYVRDRDLRRLQAVVRHSPAIKTRVST